MSGYARKRRGEEHHGSVLTEAQVREVRRLVEGEDICIVCAAKLLKINKSTAWDVANYRTWRSVK
jgi:hypothetical protein